MDEWSKKMWCLFTIEIFKPQKRNEILLFTSQWTEPYNIILSEVSQVQEAKCHISSLTCDVLSIYE
jgi:hypothetical protein